MQANTSSQQLIGIISDTHGLIRPEALAALRGVDLILHAGDIGKPHVIDELKSVAPVIAIRGNIDKDSWAEMFPIYEVVEVGELSIYMLHDVKQLDLDPSAAGFRVVVSGHTHQASVEERRGVLYVNPGSAGPRRFKLPVSVTRLIVDGTSVRAEVIKLAV